MSYIILTKAISQKIKDDSIILFESNTMNNSMSSISSEEDEKEDYSVSASIDFKLIKAMTKNEDSKTNKLKIEEKDNNDNKSDKELSINNNGLFSKREKNSFQVIFERPSNLKIDKKLLRTNKRKSTVNESALFYEYYNGQYDESIYLYAGIGTLVNQNFKKLYYGTFRYGKKEGIGILYTIKDKKI